MGAQYSPHWLRFRQDFYLILSACSNNNDYRGDKVQNLLPRLSAGRAYQRRLLQLPLFNNLAFLTGFPVRGLNPFPTSYVKTSAATTISGLEMQSITNSLNLSGQGWQLIDAKGQIKAPFAVPGDVHSTLLANEIVPDPYWRDNETSLDWVHENQWMLERQFEFTGDPSKRHFLVFETVDCLAEFYLNDVKVGDCNNQFLRWEFDVSGQLKSGQNHIRIVFHSSSQDAQNQAANTDIAMPYQTGNCRLPHFNYLRKTQCHAGWDWNIALAPLGIYGDVTLLEASEIKLDDLMVRQNHLDSGDVELEIEAFYDAETAGQVSLSASICGVDASMDVQFYPGKSSALLKLVVPTPPLWWPAGHGAQALHELKVQLGMHEFTKTIGFRKIELNCQADEIGNKFAFVINGREIFAKGANWIPADALPARGTPEVTRDLLQSAIDANMNMIRVWGGGQYEPDWFYDLCSEMGILVWQDFMFACNIYPAHNRDWLKSVRKEADQQIKRLSSHASMALWCGDNELVGALNWYPETKHNRDRYLAIYDRLNHALEEAIDDLRPDIAFWPSSPSAGRLDYADAWHDDRAGDMHFWDVWHSAKDFEHYRTVKPRFCSEFGFQSFPSMKLIEQFTEPKDRNVSSKVMDVHQRNIGGNSRIVETISRYFRFPDSFEDMVYLSQISQALAMQTSIEFWRSQSPRCMGTLYWQLNDTWPVASWSSLEYGGHWKLTHYLAKRFFAPTLVSGQPSEDGNSIDIIAVADHIVDEPVNVLVELVSTNGEITKLGEYQSVLDANKGTIICSLSQKDVPSDCFLHINWFDVDGQHLGSSDYLPNRPKTYDFGTPEISVDVNANAGEITLLSDKPALYVTYDHGGADIYSDNCFTLLPGRPKVIKILRKRSATELDHSAPVQYLKS